MASQWERLLKNQGTWVGSFTRFSAIGELLSDVPSQVSLKPLDRGNLMRQEIRKYPPGEAPQETVLEYRSLNRSVLFFENGAFSQGSIQWSPIAEFGAELGLIHGSERLRLVQLFPRQRQLDSITLIREHLEGSEATERSPLSVDQLIGTWQGAAVTLYPDLRPAECCSTRLEVQRSGSEVLQTLSWANSPPLTSAGTIQGSQIYFSQSNQPITVLMLPDGAAATFPTDIVSGEPLFLEVGWLIQPHLRQRMMRRYNAQGSWASLTLMTEQRVE